MTDFRMPSLGADMDAGTLVAWRVRPGDGVHRGDVVADVETQKGVFEVDVPLDGVIEELVVAPGTKVPVGAVLAHLRNGEAAPAARAPAGEAPAPPAPAPSAPSAPAAAAGPVDHAHRASPLARRIAAALGVDLATVHGSGPGGVITRADVERAAAPATTATPTPPAPRAIVDAYASVRQAIAAAVSRSKREIPHYYLSEDIDFAAAAAWLQAENLRRPVAERLLPAALLLRAVAVALRRHPDLNGTWTANGLVRGDAVHLGVAIALRGGGLIAPAIRDADARDVGALMAALRDLVARTRAGGLRASEMSGATITVTNLGDEGVATVFGVIHPPQVAIVGFGRIAERPWAAGGMLGVRPVVTATLAADHRATDGHYGALFLAEVGRLLQHPEAL